MIVSHDTIMVMKPPFQINSEILNLCTSIALLIGKCEGLHLNSPQPQLRRQNRIKTIQATLEIEGNTLSIDQVTVVIEGKHIRGPGKDVLEVQSAIKAYDLLSQYKVMDIESFLYAHQILLKNIENDAGRFRSSNVGVLKGSKVSHVAPKYSMVPQLMSNLFSFLKNDKDTHVLIKASIFHYEVEFIHPFIDGNGRMGRLWQTVILVNNYPVFEYLPLESVIKDNQVKYYEVLGNCDAAGDSTEFIVFMLNVIHDTLERFILDARPGVQTAETRLDKAKKNFVNNWFSRRQYLALHKDISTATASRDLLFGINNEILSKRGEKALTMYQFS